MVNILLKAVEIKEGIPVDVIEGSVPKKQVDNCKIGEILNSNKV